MPDFKDMLNRKLVAVELSASRETITFRFQGGFARNFGVEGDCCSNSWIEHLELPNDVAGATLLSVDEGGPITQDHPEHDDGGEIVLEYRNSSNGYYGGYLVDA